MHRVELKESLWATLLCVCILSVPNAPCGVERQNNLATEKTLFMFLMHRVELKAMCLLSDTFVRFEVFLMHRVELKAIIVFAISSLVAVPNAPCGVESS